MEKQSYQELQSPECNVGISSQEKAASKGAVQLLELQSNTKAEMASKETTASIAKQPDQELQSPERHVGISRHEKAASDEAVQLLELQGNTKAEAAREDTTASIAKPPDQELQSLRRHVGISNQEKAEYTICLVYEKAYDRDREVYPREHFCSKYGDYWEKAWKMAIEVTKQVMHTVFFLGDSGYSVDNVIFVETKEDKPNIPLAQKYNLFAMSTVAPLYWRAEGVQRWNLDPAQKLTKEQGHILWTEWKQHFAQNELSPDQRDRGRKFIYSSHQSHVRKICGSMNMAQQLINNGVYTKASLLAIINHEISRRSPEA